MPEVQAWQTLIGSDADKSVLLRDGSVDRTILMCRAVVVAKSDKRPQLEAQVLWRFRMIVFPQFVLDDCRVLAMDHEYRFLDLNALDFKSEDRKWVEPKLLQVTESLR